MTIYWKKVNQLKVAQLAFLARLSLQDFLSDLSSQGQVPLPTALDLHSSFSKKYSP